jgi:hypothetical protein
MEMLTTKYTVKVGKELVAIMATRQEALSLKATYVAVGWNARTIKIAIIRMAECTVVR